jgi:hypothetical protein
VVCNPRGYQTATMPQPENAAFNPTLMVAIAADRAAARI